MRTRNVWPRLGALLWLVPVAFALQHVGFDGVPNAEGCPGGAPAVGWESLNVANANGLDRVPIATDGFVLLVGRFESAELDPELRGVSVRARDSSDNPVPGQLRLLHTDVDDDIRRAHLGWKADQALSIGTVLYLTWSAGEEEAGAGGAGATSSTETVELEVVDEPTPLPTPTVALGAWLEVRHGVGPLVECESSSSCGTDTIQVPTQETRLVGVQTSWKPPEVSGMVAWQLRTEASSPKNGVEVLAPFGSQALISRLTDTNAIYIGFVAFADDATDHCVVVVARDLWTGDERRSEPRCEVPGEPAYERSDHGLLYCDAPPTPESTSLWCEYQVASPLCEGVGGGTAGNAAGGKSGSEAGGPSGSGDSGRNGAEPSADESARASRVSSACQFAPATGDLTLAAASLCALASLISQRRRRRH